MKKITYLALSMLLICFMHVNASAQVIMPTWSYTFENSFLDSSGKPRDANPVTTSAFNWKPTTGDSGKFYFDYIIQEFDFFNIDADGGTLVSNLRMSADGHSDMSFELVFDVSEGYGLTFTLNKQNSTQTDSFTAGENTYRVRLSVYDILIDNDPQNVPLTDGEVISFEIDPYDPFEIDYKLSIDAGTSLVLETFPPIDPPAPTPEPATMLLTGLGLAGIGFVKRRRNKI